jgi:copper homeostasis protein
MTEPVTSSTTGKRILVEAAVENAAAAIAAERAGVDRIELCQRLDIGGTTPSLEVIAEVLRQVRIPVHVMVRPRGGDFTYTNDEISLMMKDISLIRSLGPAAIVTGVVGYDGEMHTVNVTRLVNAAHGLPVTFHRAFDSFANPPTALEALIAVGARAVLTSGNGSSASAGMAAIAALERQARNRIRIIAAGGVRAHNVREIVERTRVREIHARFVSEEQMRALVAAVRS